MLYPQPKITVLLAARKNSKYLAKFLFGLYERTSDINRIEILCMAHEQDTWNQELFHFYGETIAGLGIRPIKFRFENLGLGRAGLAEYYNILAKEAQGEWIIYFCEDHFINVPNWDIMIYEKIRQYELNPDHVSCLIPKFDNVGAMNQILSRGYVKALGGKLGRHGNIDSYINDLNRLAFGIAAERPNHKPGDRLIKFDDEMFHDFTHDVPSPMADSHMQSVISERGKRMPKYEDPVIMEYLTDDAALLKAAMEAER